MTGFVTQFDFLCIAMSAPVFVALGPLPQPFAPVDVTRSTRFGHSTKGGCDQLHSILHSNYVAKLKVTPVAETAHCKRALDLAGTCGVVACANSGLNCLFFNWAQLPEVEQTVEVLVG